MAKVIFKQPEEGSKRKHYYRIDKRYKVYRNLFYILLLTNVAIAYFLYDKGVLDVFFS